MQQMHERTEPLAFLPPAQLSQEFIEEKKQQEDAKKIEDAEQPLEGDEEALP